MFNESNNSRDITTCVLLADSFDSNFHNDPKFSEFNGSNIIDFNLQWLYDNKIRECFVVYSQQQEKVEKFMQEQTLMKVHPVFINPEEGKTVGDQLRQIHFRQAVTKDFLLVFGDVISNVKLEAVFDQYKKLTKDTVLMTLLTKGITDDCYVIDRTTQEILQIHDMTKAFKLNGERIQLGKKMDSYVLRSDLASCGIYICSPQVLKGFKETFEFQTINDFIQGMLSSEIYDEKIQAFIIKDSQVAVRANQAAGYYQAYHCLINRYLHPYTIPKKKEQFIKYLDYNKYIKTREPMPNVKIGHSVYIGQNTAVGQKSSIYKSILCRNITIGSGCHLKYCIVLDGTNIPDGSTFENCLIESNNGELNVVNFGGCLRRETKTLQNRELFQEIVQKKNDFYDQLKLLTGEPPNEETFDELTSLRKSFNRQPRSFIADTLQSLAPSTTQQINNVVKQWGTILKKTCQNNALQLIQATMDCCNKIPKIKPAFHVFIQFMYKYQVLSANQIIQWWDNDKSNEYFTTLCSKFVAMMKESLEDDDEEEEDDDE